MPLSISLIKRLYYKKELSTVEIANLLNVTPWVVLGFMRRNHLARRTAAESNRKKFYRSSLSFSIKKKLSPKEKELKIAGIMIYWAEGFKFNENGGNRYAVDLTNSDPRIINLFLSFLRRICRIKEEKLRVQLYCYSDQNVESLKKYWYKLTNIPLSNFIKPYIRKDFLPEKRGKMKYGLVHIRYYDKRLLRQIDEWIKKYCIKFKLNNGWMAE